MFAGGGRLGRANPQVVEAATAKCPASLHRAPYDERSQMVGPVASEIAVVRPRGQKQYTQSIQGNESR